MWITKTNVVIGLRTMSEIATSPELKIDIPRMTPKSNQIYPLSSTDSHKKEFKFPPLGSPKGFNSIKFPPIGKIGAPSKVLHKLDLDKLNQRDPGLIGKDLIKQSMNLITYSFQHLLSEMTKNV